MQHFFAAPQEAETPRIGKQTDCGRGLRLGPLRRLNSLQVCHMTPPSDAFGILIPLSGNFQLYSITRGPKLVQRCTASYFATREKPLLVHIQSFQLKFSPPLLEAFTFRPRSAGASDVLLGNKSQLAFHPQFQNFELRNATRFAGLFKGLLGFVSLFISTTSNYLSSPASVGGDLEVVTPFILLRVRPLHFPNRKPHA